MKKGTLYGVGTGPGDPELLTQKAVRLLRECDVVAAPDGERTAYKIAAEFAAGKPALFCDLPMTRDPQRLEDSRSHAADTLCALLDEGKNVVFLTLGDPSIYSTYGYLHQRVLARGYTAELVPGVPSFCAAAAALGRPLCEGGEPLHILPATHRLRPLPEGALVLMKAGRAVPEACAALAADGRLAGAALVERCGMEGQRIVPDLSDPSVSRESTGYFSLILVRGGADE